MKKVLATVLICLCSCMWGRGWGDRKSSWLGRGRWPQTGSPSQPQVGYRICSKQSLMYLALIWLKSCLECSPLTYGPAINIENPRTSRHFLTNKHGIWKDSNLCIPKKWPKLTSSRPLESRQMVTCRSILRTVCPTSHRFRSTDFLYFHLD